MTNITYSMEMTMGTKPQSNDFLNYASNSFGSYLFEGDILLTPLQIDGVLRAYTEPLRLKRASQDRRHNRSKRKLYANKDALWKSFPIDYKINSNLGSVATANIREALSYWERNTCVSFRSNNSADGDHLDFFKGQGCYSMIGKAGGRQGISIGAGCERTGIIMHEIAHALGLWHEQSRPDAACCIQVLSENIITSMLGNFLSRSWSEVRTMGVPYDVGSVLHYGGSAFARDWRRPTIRTRRPAFQRTIGQRQTPSFYDVKILNAAYCMDRCGMYRNECERGGYPHPANCRECICPSGLGGPRCERSADPTGGASCGGRVEVDGTWARLSSPGLPLRGFSVGQSCAWLLVAPAARRVMLEFRGLFQLACASTCLDFVEVKNASDLANTGARFCCHKRPEGFIYSEGNEMIVIFSASYAPDIGFEARVRMYPSVSLKVENKPILGTISKTTTTTFRPTTTTNTEEPTKYPTTMPTLKPTTAVSWTLPPRQPTTTFLEPTATPTSTPDVVLLKGKWGSWEPWSRCSEKCGACGTRARERPCALAPCSGPRHQMQKCGFVVCVGATSLCMRLNFVGATAVPGQSSVCPGPACCSPYVPRGGLCTLAAPFDPDAPRLSVLPRLDWTPCLGDVGCGACDLELREPSAGAVEARRCHAQPCPKADDRRRCVDVLPPQLCRSLPFPKGTPQGPCCAPMKLANGVCAPPQTR